MLKVLSLLFLMFAAVAAQADVSVPRSKQYAITTYDVSVNGGESVPHNTGLVLPAGAFVTDVWVYINTAFTDSGTGSFAIQCAGTNDLMMYNDITALSVNDVIGRHLQPVANNAISASGGFIGPSATTGKINMSFQNGSIPSACEVKAIVRGDSGFVPLTAGKASIVVEYFKLY